MLLQVASFMRSTADGCTANSKAPWASLSPLAQSCTISAAFVVSEEPLPTPTHVPLS